MISFIRGELAEIEESKVIIDVNGVGYGIFMPVQSMNRLPQTGREVKLHTYLNVKEDAMQLFGFLTKDELAVFRLLIGVNGIGPKGGLAILSQMTPDELRFAVASNDVKAISASPGIGKKTAEKLILELRDKLSIEDALEHSITQGEAQGLPANSAVQGEAVQALVALGYGNSEALKAVKQVDMDTYTDVEDVLKQALKHMM